MSGKTGLPGRRCHLNTGISVQVGQGNPAHRPGASFVIILAGTRKNMNQNPLDTLFVADPELGNAVSTIIREKGVYPEDEEYCILVENTLDAISMEISFGYAAAMGYAQLIGSVSRPTLDIFTKWLKSEGETGPTLGKLIALHLPVVLLQKDSEICTGFHRMWEILNKKGPYTLKPPMEGLTALLKQGDMDSANAFIQLICTIFSLDLTYNQSLRLSHEIPAAVTGFPPEKRVCMTEALTRLMKEDASLFDPFEEGLEKGLAFLGKEGLFRFAEQVVSHFREDPKKGKKFLSLSSRQGKDALEECQTTAVLVQEAHQLSRYLRARTGLSVPILPFSQVQAATRVHSPKKSGESGHEMNTENNERTFVQFSEINHPGNTCMGTTDGSSFFLPEEIGYYDTKKKNRTLYQVITKMVAGLVEFGTFDFDLGIFIQKYPDIARYYSYSEDETTGDMIRFLEGFSQKEQARDIFTLFEHGRIRWIFSGKYPGIIKTTSCILRKEAERLLKTPGKGGTLFPLYLMLHPDLDMDLPQDHLHPALPPMYERVAGDFFTLLEAEKTTGPEESAMAAASAFREIHQKVKENYTPLVPLFQPVLLPELFYAANREYDRDAGRIARLIREAGATVYKTGIRRELKKGGGKITGKDMEYLLMPAFDRKNPHNQMKSREDNRLSAQSLAEKILSRPEMEIYVADSPENSAEDQKNMGKEVFRYREWDIHMQDYLFDHVMVREHKVPEMEGRVYEDSLARHRGLVQKIKRVFEFMKPGAFRVLRRWPEGEEFDYRAMLDFAVEKKAGLIPGEGLYIKRVKETRDVAVFLLVDISKSTDNPVQGLNQRVVDVEKDAIVLFCEALETVGDTYQVAGFSGTGRLGVDIFRIKDFHEPLSKEVKKRVGAVSPQRSTRMGAAIRHAAKKLSKVEARVRILLIVTDGFPNDTGYKGEYAIADTSKAMQEARAGNIHTRVITVNISGAKDLDALYGSLHHNVISDVRGLPDKLAKMYSALTR